MRRLLLSAVLIAVLPASASAAGYRAGFGMAVTTPPLWSKDPAAAAKANADYAGGFATCPAALFPDHGRFALQEPFRDLDGNGQWDSGETFDRPPEPYCDANANGRWDGIYTSGQQAVPARGVTDDIDVRAFAVASGTGKPLVYASVVQQGLFENYTDAMRARFAARLGAAGLPAADLVVSATHNESSPDTVGIYGAYTNPAGTSTSSGIDEYYMLWLEDKVAQAALTAVKSLTPARLYARQVPLPDTITERYSRQFPTFDTLAKPESVPAAIDTKVGVLQARADDGKPVFTVLSFAAHNQEMGRVGADFSSDWPGYFADAFQRDHGGGALFLVGDNGSQEDPSTNPEVIPKGSENHGPEQYKQARATGEEFARIVASAAADAAPLADGPVGLARIAFCVPLENAGFAALAPAGVFGQRQAYVCTPDGTPQQTAPDGREFRTYVSVGTIGPDLQLIANPAEAFPALMVGSNWGKEEASCDAPNPAAPSWHARAAFRFQVGLADDLIGYLIPAWAYVGDPPQLFPTACQSDANGQDHKLEDEGLGPTASNAVADRLAGILDKAPDPTAHVRAGRYVLADGSLSHRPTGAVAVLLAEPKTTGLSLQKGRLIGAPGIRGVGGRAVDATGVFMDYDGQPQARAALATRGVMVFSVAGCATERDYVTVFEPLTAPKTLGAVSGDPAGGVAQNCARGDATQDDTAGGAGRPSGTGSPGSPSANATCADTVRPVTAVARRGLKLRRGHLDVRGTARDRGCHGALALVRVDVWRHAAGGRCRFLGPRGRLGAPRSCRRPIFLLAHGTRHWRLSRTLRALPPGRYQLAARAVDRTGRRAILRRGRNLVRLRVRG